MARKPAQTKTPKAAKAKPARAKSAAAKKPAAKSTAAKKPAAKKPAAKKPAAKKAAPAKTARKPAAKKPAAKKPAAKSSAASKPAARKPTAKKKPAAKKPAARKPAARKAEAPQAADMKLEFAGSRQFVPWLNEVGASLAFTTYQTGKVFMIGLQPNGRLSIFERTFNRCMGLGLNGEGFYMSSLYQLWRFENVLAAGQNLGGYDRAYLPINGHTTGDLDIHDVAVDAGGRVIFVNTLFSCLASIDATSSFVPLWWPPFISKLAAEDRCHLNGLAMQDGKPKYVTAVAATDVADGWRDKRADGGVVIDVTTGEIVATGLSMPHSPRVHDGTLWLLNSGTGEIGTIDLGNGKFQPVAFCPGYLRGLSFIGPFAVVGLSKLRENKTFSGLPLDDALAQRNAETQCALYVIDTRTGDAVHWLKMEGLVEELYDVAVLPGVRRPMAFGFKTDEIRRTLNVGATGTL